MTIGYLTPEYPHPKVLKAAGIGTSIRNLSQALVAKGHSVHIFVFNQKTSQTFDDEGITIHLIEFKKYFTLSYLLYRKYIATVVRKAVKQYGIDIIEAPDWTGVTAFSKYSVPIAIRLHGSDAFFCSLEKRQQKKRTFMLENLAINRADALVSPTQFAAKLSKQIFSIRKKIDVIPNGVSLAQFENPNPETFERGLILYVGTIIRKKGVLELPHILAEVLKEIPHARLLLLGTDASDISTGNRSTWEMIQNLNPSVSDKISWPGRVSPEDLTAYIRKAHVCVFPTFGETQGMVTIEAMAMQKAVVSSNFDWVRELIVDGESGLLADPSAHVEFASKIISLMHDDGLTAKIGKSARERAEQLFDIDKLADANIEFYKSVIGR